MVDSQNTFYGVASSMGDQMDLLTGEKPGVVMVSHTI
jgi:hypothetical protein